MIAATRSEVRKIFTTRLWWGMAIGMAILAALISMGFAALVGTTMGDDPAADTGNPFATLTIGTAQLIYNAGLIQNMTTLFPLALGVLLITTEYRHKTITATFLSTPNRWVVLISKLIAVADRRPLCRDPCPRQRGRRGRDPGPGQGRADPVPR